ncbi:hypothetical protein FRC03_012217 [Tulasnella sp. 419]|nr:hypothetical protein FRC03_012217 [Tulasnella sp. 419]
MQAKFRSVLLFLCSSAVAIVLQQPLNKYRDDIPRDTSQISYEEMFKKIDPVEEIEDRPYDRKGFGKFSSAKRDYLLKTAAFKSWEEPDHLGKKIRLGTWYSPWDNRKLKGVHACAMEIDHVVPLKEAWDAGAHTEQWETKGWRSMFMKDEENLVVVSRSANRFKGDRGPPQYFPKWKACKFIKIWIKIKYKYGLLATINELESLKKKGKPCGLDLEIAGLELESNSKTDRTEIIESYPVANMSELPIDNHFDECDGVTRALPTGSSDAAKVKMLDALSDQIGSTDQAGQTNYDREKFYSTNDETWIRAKLLEEYALRVEGVKQFEPITTLDGVTEIYGSWRSRWDGVEFENVHSCVIDIDHTVSLNHAWHSGAHGWTEKKRKCFAKDPKNLELMYMSSNRKKGDSGFPEWTPFAKREKCAFVLRWLLIKYRYELAVDSEEYKSLEQAMEKCRLHWY